MALLIVAVAIIIITYSNIDYVAPDLGPFEIYHWASIIGAAIIVLFLAFYSFWRRRYPKTRKILFPLHGYINLIAFLFISLNFGVLGKVIQADTGTGFLEYSIVVSIIITGILRRFQIASAQTGVWRFLHLSFALFFFLLLITHVVVAIQLD
jgi:hypothetical protein